MAADRNSWRHTVKADTSIFISQREEKGWVGCFLNMVSVVSLY